MVMRCYRHAVGNVTLTMPGGMLEEKEDPLAGIQRELLEETGYVADQKWQSLGALWGATQPEAVEPITCSMAVMLIRFRNQILVIWRN